jgi:hypothetical protein
MTERSRRIGEGVGATKSLRRALGAWQAAVVRLDTVDPVTTELVRLRCARYHDCHT